jgi:phage internal scaffolding protein
MKTKIIKDTPSKKVIAYINEETGKVIRKRVINYTVGESLTEQHHESDHNMQKIMDKVIRGAPIPFKKGGMDYGEFDSELSYQDCCNRLVEAETQFMSLPSKLRERFNNDPGKLIGFLNDESNRKEAEALGLVNPKVTPVVPKTEKQTENTAVVEASKEVEVKNND